MLLKYIEILFFYILFISHIIFYAAVGNILWNYLSTFFNIIINNWQKNDEYLYNHSKVYNNDSTLRNNFKTNSNIHARNFNLSGNLNYLNINISKFFREKRKIYISTSRKWDFPIVYEIQKDKFNETLIDEVIKNIQSETCIQFVKRNGKPSKLPVLKYFDGTSCVSYHGRQIKLQVQSIMLTKDCQNWKDVMHETLHAMGLIHEQSRQDRNNYVSIQWENIPQGLQKNFDIINSTYISTYNITYDYGSVMHYYPNSWGKNGTITINPKEDIYLHTLGSSLTASFNDFKALNLHYCSNECNDKINCQNGGYQNPKNCSICKCPEGLRGTRCKTKSLGHKNCGSITTAESFTKEIIVNGSKICIFHINVTETKKIEIKLVNITFPYSPVCNPHNCLEVKYKKDLTITGARICKALENYILISEGSHVIIFYRSINDTNSANIMFRIFKKNKSKWKKVRNNWKIYS